MTTRTIEVEAFGDPACPYDFSAEPARLRVRWRYGDALVWRHRMVGLSLTRDDYATRGISLELLSQGRAMLAQREGMPIASDVAPRHVATAIACHAVLAVRRGAPTKVDAFLRRLRVLALSHQRLLDETATLREAATLAGIDAADLTTWADDPQTDEDLARDMADARDPVPAERVMVERLAATPDGGWRLTCPSYRLHRGDAVLYAPGFQPVRVYEALLANLAPDVTPRPLPGDVAEVLEWAPYPLATMEVAVLLDTSRDAAREALEAAGARLDPVAGDGYWSA